MEESRDPDAPDEGLESSLPLPALEKGAKTRGGGGPCCTSWGRGGSCCWCSCTGGRRGTFGCCWVLLILRKAAVAFSMARMALLVAGATLTGAPLAEVTTIK